MRIAFIIPIYIPADIDGSATVIKDLAEVVAKNGNDAVIITSDALTSRYWYDPIFGKRISESEEVINHVRIIRLKSQYFISAFLFILNKLLQPFISRAERNSTMGKFSDWLTIRSLGPWVNGLDEVILKSHADMYVLAPFPLGICRSAYEILKENYLPYCVIPFIKDDVIFRNRLLVEILNNAAYIFCPTEYEKKYIRSFATTSRVQLLPSTIDAEYLNDQRREITAFADKLRSSPQFNNKKIVLFVGRKGTKKGVIDAAKAVQNLSDQSIVFCAMGENMSGWDEYRKSNPLGIIDVPYKRDIEKYAYYEACSVFMLPSTSDNFPLVFLEAWQFSKPVIAYDYYSIRELLSDGSGFLAKSDNIRDLSSKLKFVLDHSNEAAKAGRIGHAKVKRYSRDAIVRKYFIDPIRKVHL